MFTENAGTLYFQQTYVLGTQLKRMYPLIDVLVLTDNMVTARHVDLLHKIGLTVRVRPIPRVDKDIYYGQTLKFWVWNETDYDRVVYIDADTFFMRDDFDFEALMAESDEAIIACPPVWSLEHRDGRALTWNGGFFIARPSAAMLRALLASRESGHFTVFTRYYGSLFWLDQTEMGSFMAVFPSFHTPHDFQAACGDVVACCYGALTPHCRRRHLVSTPDKSNMVHGIKPLHPRDVRAGLRKQLGRDFDGRGYDRQCLETHYFPVFLRVWDDIDPPKYPPSPDRLFPSLPSVMCLLS